MGTQLTYDHIFIGSLDQAYLDQLEDSALKIYPSLDIGKCEIYPGMILINQQVD